MELYDADKLFVGYCGIVYYDWGYEVKKEELVITTLSTYDSNLYFNIFSAKKYKIFSTLKVSEGDYCILNPITLTSFVSKKYNNNMKLQNLSIIKKILNGESLNKTELKKLIIALNSKNLYKTLSNITEETSDKKKFDIKINFITTLTNKKYKLNPTTGRDNEIKQILTSLAQNRKATILIGERGVGKTSIVDEISHKISKNDIPNFLKNKKIIELNFNILNMDKNSIKQNIIDIVATAIKDDSIIFIDGLEDINNANILNILKYEFEKNNLKVIATINSNNINKDINDDIFNKIIIDEPDEDTLKQIISRVFYEYSAINNIKPLNEEALNIIITTLINLTKIENRILTNCSNRPINYDIYNPGLIIGIIDIMFADAKVNNNNELTISNILYGINSCGRIKEDIKNNYSRELKDSLNLTSLYKTHKLLKKIF